MNLKITPLRIANVPPPMSLLQLALDQKAVDVAFSKSGTKLAVLSDTDITLYSTDFKKRPVSTPSLLWRRKLSDDHFPRHVAFGGNDRLCVLTDMWDEEESFVWTNDNDEMIERGPILEASKASSLASDLESDVVFVNFQNGSLTSLNLSEEAEGISPTCSPLAQIPSFAPEVKVATLEGQVCARF